MKTLIVILTFISTSAFAIDLGTVKAAGTKAVDAGKNIAAACKQEKIEFCKTVTELAPLKECLTQNKEKLSDGCKKAIGL